MNFAKSSLMLINFSRRLDFDPRVSIKSEELKVVRTASVLGMKLQDNLKWDSHVNYIVAKASSKLYLVKKMIENGIEVSFLIDFFNKEIRSILEYGAIVFHHGLTLSLSNLIESVQKNFVKMLSNCIGQDFSWMEGLIFFCIEPLSLRRVTLCETFIRKTLKSERFSDMFVERNIDRHLLKQRKYKEFKSYSDRHFRSPIVALSRTANKMMT